MRIVHVASFYRSPSDGFSTALRHLGAGYQRAGHEFFLVGPGPVELRRATPTGTHITLPGLPSVAGRRSFVPVGFAILDLLNQLAPDRIEISDRLTRRVVEEWARERDIPTVVLSSDLVAPPQGASGSPTPSGNASLDLPPSRHTAVAPGVDLAEFSPLRWSQPARDRFSGGAQVLLVHVGGLTRRGAPALSLDALGVLLGRGVDARLVLAGEGVLSGRLARRAETLPVTVAERVDDARQLAVLLANVDVALSPGRGDRGIDGMGALEALAAGTPVVATATSDAASVVQGSGELTAANGSAIADGVQRVLARRVDERRSEARARAAKFPWATMVNSLIDIHEFPGLLAPEVNTSR
ncbi:glycosyltransferase [Glaciihabitans tibetensis]|nr:glycosyltransferase [Glaciihabitans tibetensis]